MINEDILDIKVEYGGKVIRLRDLPESAPALFVFYLPNSQTNQHTVPYVTKEELIEGIRSLGQFKGRLRIHQFGGRDN